MDEKRLRNSLIEIYRLAQWSAREAFKEAALAALKRILPFDKGKWGSGAVDGNSVTIHAIHHHALPAQNLEDYRAVCDGGAKDPLLQAAYGNAGHAVILSDILPYDAWRRSDLYASYARIYAIDHAMSIVVADEPTGLHTSVAIYRCGADRFFGEDDKAVFEFAAPLLIEAERINRFLDLRRLCDGLEDGAEAALCDSQGILHAAEPRFAGLLQREWPGWHGPRLPQALGGLIGRNDHGGFDFAGSRIRCQAEPRGDLLYLRAAPADPLGVLTPRQRTVAGLLIAGKSYKEIESALAIKRSTIVKHAIAIYAKLGVPNRTRLVARCAARPAGKQGE